MYDDGVDGYWLQTKDTMKEVIQHQVAKFMYERKKEKD